jgi:hypothetical protein
MFMPERIEVIHAGSRPVYEIVKSVDGLTITIRLAQHPEQKIDLISSVIPTLIQILSDMT